MTVLKYVLISSKMEIKPSIFSASNAVPGSSRIKMLDFGREETESEKEKRMLLAGTGLKIEATWKAGRMLPRR